MEYRWIDNIKEFQEIATRWDEALIRAGGENPFLLSDFIISWWKQYADDYEFRVFVVHDNNEIVGGLPLYIENAAPGMKILRYVGKVAANYTEPLYASDHANILPILEEALVERKDWDALHLNNVRSKSKLISEI